jgi:hypothetical protein
LADTHLVVTINVRQVLESPLVQKYAAEQIKEQIKRSVEATKILSDLGFDPFKDFVSVTIAWPGVPEPDKGLVVIRGKFDKDKIESKVEEIAKAGAEGLKITKAGARTVYEWLVPDQKQTLFAAIANASTIIAAPSKQLVVDALERIDGKKTATMSKQLADVLSKIDIKQSFWMAGLLSDELRKNPLLNDEKVREVLNKIESLNGGINVADDIQMQFTVTTKNDDAAKEISELLGQGVMQGKELLKVFGGNKKELAPVEELLGTLKVSTTGRAVSVNGKISKQVLEKTLR